jgi:hypothetical protein
MFAGMCAIGLLNLVVAVPMGSNRQVLRNATDSVAADLLVATCLTLLTGAILITVALVAGHLLALLLRAAKSRS